MRNQVVALRQAQETLDGAINILLVRERRTTNTYVEIHTALRNFAEALIECRRQQAALATLLAIDPRNLDGPLDEAVTPLLEEDPHA